MFNFFALKVAGGREHIIANDIRNVLEKHDLINHVCDIIIPEATFLSNYFGKKRKIKKNVLVGYLILEIEMSRELYGMISTVNGVYGFLGGKDFPRSISRKEVDKLLETISNMDNDDQDDNNDLLSINIGDNIKIKEGMFKSFIGKVIEIDEAKKRVKVSVSIFGGSSAMTTIDLSFDQIEKNV